MFRTDLKVNKKNFMDCNTYFLRRYFGIKEGILIALLLVAGLVMQLFFGTIMILVVGIVAIILMLASILFFIVTSAQTYKYEFEKRAVSHQSLTFLDEKFEIVTYEGEKSYKDIFEYKKIDRIAIKKDVVYIYATVALNYYIRRDSFVEGTFDDFCFFLKEKVDPITFKMRQKKKRIKPDYFGEKK